MNAAELRAEMGVRSTPDFEMTLPPGWTRQPVNEATLEGMQTTLRQRLLKAQQPQLYAELEPTVRQSFESMQRQGAIAFFSATEEDESTLWLPASIIASERRAEAGQTLDDMARSMIREYGAVPLRGDKRTLRFEQERSVRVGTETLVNTSIVYFTPVPGTGRRRALQLVAGFGRRPQDSADAPGLIAMKMLFDSCAASLRWRAHSAE